MKEPEHSSFFAVGIKCNFANTVGSYGLPRLEELRPKFAWFVVATLFFFAVQQNCNWLRAASWMDGFYVYTQGSIREPFSSSAVPFNTLRMHVN